MDVGGKTALELEIGVAFSAFVEPSVTPPAMAGKPGIPPVRHLVWECTRIATLALISWFVRIQRRVSSVGHALERAQAR